MIHSIVDPARGAGIGAEAVRACLFEALEALGPRRRVLALPPDGTRSRSRSGLILRLLYEYYGEALVDVMPALGTHVPMTPAELDEYYPGVPHRLFREHDWRRDVVQVGEVPSSYVRELSEGRLDFSWPVQLNRLIAAGRHDLVVSIGQVVPHEVAGMANHAKNLFVGAGGSEAIHRSHYLGAVYGMERMMGRTDTPVRALFDYASREFASSLPVLYAQTVVGPVEEGCSDETSAESPRCDDDALRGLFVGQGREPFEEAARLSRALNVHCVGERVRKAVVLLPEREFRSTWLGNKSVYRTRMALADGGELVVLAPGVSRFGEDGTIDSLIRKWGYRGTEATLRAVERDAELADNLSAAAHLIHGSSEGRFTITYCPGRLGREETESAGYRWAPLAEAMARYAPDHLVPGWNVLDDGERVFFISNPAAGLWTAEPLPD
ncbi:MAG TPA: lactate racemase domain-containing protein [Rectinemataceae bacterium]|nr:lactate racemase domain-containing protein [Rectinemataceae bacterium]